MLLAAAAATELIADGGSAAFSAIERKEKSKRMKSGITVEKLERLNNPTFPDGIARLDYRSDVDGLSDWALLLPPTRGKTCLVNLHGHGATGDQLYTRPDIRDGWLPAFRASGVGICTPNLRGVAWMGPAAASDLHALLSYLRAEHGVERFIVLGGSMGGTSTLIYSVLHPEDVAAAVALCPATDLSSYYAWCRKRNEGVIKDIADAIEASYGGTPAAKPEPYALHSALKRAAQLTMPVYVAHGTADPLIPVSQSRKLVAQMAEMPSFCYVEVPDGGHDAPLVFAPEGFQWVMKKLSS